MPRTKLCLKKGGKTAGTPIGKNHISYKPPKVEWAGTPDDWDSSKGDPPKPTTPYDGMIPKESEFEVKSGSNEITIELVPRQAS